MQQNEMPHAAEAKARLFLHFDVSQRTFRRKRDFEESFKTPIPYEQLINDWLDEQERQMQMDHVNAE